MRSKGVTTLLLSCFLAAGTVTAWAQSLADVARRERAKNQSAPKATKVYTNDNIPHVTTIEASESQTSAESKPVTPSSTVGEQSEAASSEPEKPADKQMTKEYWESEFARERANLARAQEESTLAQDEFNLALANETRELDPQRKEELGQIVATKQADAGAKRAAEEKAQQALDDLKKKFEESGAPKEWMPPEENK